LAFLSFRVFLSIEVYYFCSADVVVIALGQLIGYLNIIHNNSSTELTVEQVQRPALNIEADLPPAASFHVSHVQTLSLAESLPEQ
jgi:hypothetical protein